MWEPEKSKLKGWVYFLTWIGLPVLAKGTSVLTWKIGNSYKERPFNW